MRKMNSFLRGLSLVGECALIIERLTKPSGRIIFYYLDGYYGYHQISIHLEDLSKTTFTSSYNTFAHRQMSFRLCNAPASFQRCMMAIFSDLIEKVSIHG
jgi:hypothetical protein